MRASAAGTEPSAERPQERPSKPGELILSGSSKNFFATEDPATLRTVFKDAIHGRGRSAARERPAAVLNWIPKRAKVG